MSRSSVRLEGTPGSPGQSSIILLGDWAGVVLPFRPKLALRSQGTRPLLGHSATTIVVLALPWPSSGSFMDYLGAYLLDPWLCYPLDLGRLSQHALVLTPLRVLGMMMPLPWLCSLLPQDLVNSPAQLLPSLPIESWLTPQAFL